MSFRDQFKSKTCGELKDLTKQIKADQDLSKILQAQNQKVRNDKIKKEIARLINK